MRYRRHLTSMLVAATLATGYGTSEAQDPKAPGAETLKQVLAKKLQLLKTDDYTERNVLFQTVLAGTPDGESFPFRATLLIRDYGPGYPVNQQYGDTCVSRLIDRIYTLSPDAVGGWHVEGRMIPPLSQTVCKANPAAGVSSMPLAALEGSPAAAGPTGGSPLARPAPSR